MGTGGGRIATHLQARATGGFVIQMNGLQIHVDPGPGAIVRAKQYKVNPTKTDIIVATHCHTDHIDDLLITLEAMTRGATKRRGHLIANRTVIEGHPDYPKLITPFHRQLLEGIHILEPRKEVEVKGVKFVGTKAVHDEPNPLGLKIYGEYTIGYTSDTEYFLDLAKQYEDVDMLIINVLRPFGIGFKGHMTCDHVVEILKEINPKLTVLTHFGMKMITSGPDFQAAKIERMTGKKVVAAKDGMVIRWT